MWHLIALSLFFGIVDGFFIPASQSIPPQLVPKEDLPSANALNELSIHGSQLLGPLLGAACVALIGPTSAFGFDGLTFIASALCLFAMRLTPRADMAALGRGDMAEASSATTPIFDVVNFGQVDMAEHSAAL